MMPTSEENKSVIRRFWDAMNTRRWDAFDALLAPDVVRHCQATPEWDVRSREQFTEFCRWEAAVFPESRQTLTHLVAEGDLIAVWATYAGTQKGLLGPFPPLGKSFQIEFGAVFRLAQGKIAEWWVTWDTAALLTQLGHLPAPPGQKGER
jgi:steroid delta-isomerase-like uncharacterized protein